jgi:polysaccharide biosynthesis protein PslG
MLRRLGVVLAACLLLAACQGSVPSGEMPTASPSPTPTSRPTLTGPVTGLTIPWAVGGTRIERSGEVRVDPGEWPDFPVDAIRLWDTRTTWLNLEPADGQWDFVTLDAHLAKARAEGVRDVMLVLAGTPRWAAQRVAPDDAPWLGPGSASPPRDLDQWRDYVSTVATRYRGQIDTYEIGNEPNLLTFWNGTPAERADLVDVAIDAIRTADPGARIVVDGGLLRSAADLDALDTWLGPLAGDPRIDVVSVHLYPSSAGLADVPDLLSSTRARLADLGFADRPAWVTEMNVADGSAMPRAQQARAVTDLTAQAHAAGFERVYWYAWTDLGPLSLIQLFDGTPGGDVLAEG